MSIQIKRLEDQRLNWFSLENYEAEKALNTEVWLNFLSQRMTDMDFYEWTIGIEFENKDQRDESIKGARELVERYLKSPFDENRLEQKLDNYKHPKGITNYPVAEATNKELAKYGVMMKELVRLQSETKDVDAASVFSSDLEEDVICAEKILDQDFLKKQMDIPMTTNLLVNLRFSDKQLIDDFKLWLNHKRGVEKKQVRSASIDKAKSPAYRIIAYTDLMNWQRINDFTITKQVIVELLYPKQSRSRDYIFTTIQPLYQKIKTELAENGFSRFYA